jgi:hypothetical protein
MWTGRSKRDRSIHVIEPSAGERLPSIARRGEPSKASARDARRIRCATDATRDLGLAARGASGGTSVVGR